MIPGMENGFGKTGFFKGFKKPLKTS